MALSMAAAGNQGSHGGQVSEPHRNKGIQKKLFASLRGHNKEQVGEPPLPHQTSRPPACLDDERERALAR